MSCHYHEPKSMPKHREPTQSVCVTDCLYIYYSKCTGFTVCFTYSDTSLSMYVNHGQISVELLYLWCIVVLLPQQRFFGRF